MGENDRGLYLVAILSAWSATTFATNIALGEQGFSNQVRRMATGHIDEDNVSLGPSQMAGGLLQTTHTGLRIVLIAMRMPPRATYESLATLALFPRFWCIVWP